MFNLENTMQQASIDWLFHEIPARGGCLHSVGLRLSEEATEARRAGEQRRDIRKHPDHELYRKLRAERSFSRPHIPRTDLVLDADQLSAIDAAFRFERHFKL